jgi:hypothetical protein
MSGPCSKGQKNDCRYPKAIAEAVPRPAMKFVATNTADQLDLQALHRVRWRSASQFLQSSRRCLGRHDHGAWPPN